MIAAKTAGPLPGGHGGRLAFDFSSLVAFQSAHVVGSLETFWMRSASQGVASSRSKPEAAPSLEPDFGWAGSFPPFPPFPPFSLFLSLHVVHGRLKEPCNHAVIWHPLPGIREIKKWENLIETYSEIPIRGATKVSLPA